jgi:integrase
VNDDRLPDVAPEPASPDSAKEKRPPRGFGYAYRRGRVWWIRYSHGGKDHRESTGSEREADAWRKLKQRWKQIGANRFVFGEDKVRMEHLFAALELDYQNNGRRSARGLRWRLAPLRAAFGEDRAIDVTEARIERYKADRLASFTRTRFGVGTRRVSPATVNRELAALIRAFRVGVRQKRLSVAPTIELLKEAAPRQGFLEPDAFERVVTALPADLQDVARFAYLSGWRKGEVQTLGWPDVDRSAGRIVLRREHSKNGEPRVLPLLGELAALIERRWIAREYETEDGTSALSPFVFHRDGQPVGDFRKAWESACQAAGVSGTLFHDLRRSAVRNMDRAGVSQSVAMALSGHKTASVYRRYRIVDEKDLREALERTQASIAARPLGTVTPLRDGAKRAGR